MSSPPPTLDPDLANPHSREASRELALRMTRLAQMVRNAPSRVEAAEVLELARALNAQGRLDSPGFYYDTALSLAAKMRSEPLIASLLELGADPNAPGLWQAQPLALAMCAFETGASARSAIACGRLLWAAGADLEAMDDRGQAALHWCASNPEGGPAAQWLLGLGANPSARIGDQFAPIHCAAREGNLAVARALIEAGADLFATAFDHRQSQMSDPAQIARCWSQFHNNPEIIDWLENAPRALRETQAIQSALPPPAGAPARRRL